MDLFDSNPLPFDLPKSSEYQVEEVSPAVYRITVPGGELLYAPRFFNDKICARSVEYFSEASNVDWRSGDYADRVWSDPDSLNFTNIPWKHDSIQIYGKSHKLPRLTSWHGDKDASYTYSRIKSQPNPWNPALSYLREKLEALSGATFNSVLLNWYRGGDDHLSWHADDEPELGVNPTIASVSFGAERDFVLRRNDVQSEKIKIPLTNGSVLLMIGALQDNWQHSVPKRKNAKGPRLNLTYRYINVD